MENNIYIRKSSRSSISLRIDNSGNLYVYCPLKFSDAQIQEIINEKKQWIDKHIQNIINKRKIYQSYYNYSKIMYLGKSYDIIVSDKKLQIGESTINIRTNVNLIKTLKNWLIKRSDFIFDRLDYWAKIIGVKYLSKNHTNARKKWGSCDSKQNIKMNFRLIMLDIKLIDYVCIHELCHIIHLNHSKRFWKKVEDFLPDYKTLRKELKKYSFVLELF